MNETTTSSEETQTERVSLLAKARQEGAGRQEELPFAFIAGQTITDLPKDLYIPRVPGARAP